MKVESTQKFYNDYYSTHSSKELNRYRYIYKSIGDMISDGERVLDIGCGIGILQSYIKHYAGFDFSAEAIKLSNSPKVFIGDVYDKTLYTDNYDTFISTEVLEHVDDIRVINNIPKGKRFIFSVPSFMCAAHLRTYTEQVIRQRFIELLHIKYIIRFNRTKTGFMNNNYNNCKYILLVDSIKL